MMQPSPPSRMLAPAHGAMHLAKWIGDAVKQGPR